MYNLSEKNINICITTISCHLNKTLLLLVYVGKTEAALGVVVLPLAVTEAVSVAVAVAVAGLQKN